MIKFLLFILNYVTTRLHTEADKLEAKAIAAAQAANALIQQRLDHLDAANKVRAIANKFKV